jgi:hypothetical protein
MPSVKPLIPKKGALNSFYGINALRDDFQNPKRNKEAALIMSAASLLPCGLGSLRRACA